MDQIQFLAYHDLDGLLVCLFDNLLCTRVRTKLLLLPDSCSCPHEALLHFLVIS